MIGIVVAATAHLCYRCKEHHALIPTYLDQHREIADLIFFMLFKAGMCAIAEVLPHNVI